MTRRLQPLIGLLALLSLLLPAAVRADACPHAPAPRLRVGMAAVVAPGVERLNMRALPAVDTGIQSVVFAGIGFTVIGGPSCNSNYNWWRVEMGNGTRGWVAEGTWDEYYVIPAADASRVTDPFAWSCLPPQRPGVCYAP